MRLFADTASRAFAADAYFIGLISMKTAWALNNGYAAIATTIFTLIAFHAISIGFNHTAAMVALKTAIDVLPKPADVVHYPLFYG